MKKIFAKFLLLLTLGFGLKAENVEQQVEVEGVESNNLEAQLFAN